MTKSILICLTIVSTTFLYSQDLTTDLLLHYPFDGNANDESVNQLHGIPNATLAEDRFGNANSAYHFNGVDEYIDLPISPVLKPQLPITYSCWVKFDDALDVSNSVIATNDFATDSHSGAWISLSGTGKFAVGFGDNTGNTSSPNRRSKAGITTLESGVWYHLVAVIRGPQDMDLYVDCRNDEGSYSGSGGSMAYSSAPGSIGRKDSYYAGPASYFQGTIDDFRYWERGLSEEEISLLCQWDLDLEENELLNDFAFKVFPNPANSEVKIEASDLAAIKEYKIMSVDGKEVLADDLNGSIDISNLSKGMYVVSLFNGNGVVLGTQKLVVN